MIKDNLPLVSIAICTFNGVTHLHEQLSSLVEQTYNNIEIIAVDDCSTDDTLMILQIFEEKYPFVKVFKNGHNLGYVKNFEKAISLCNGAFIALCDQDDIWDLKKIETQITNIGDALLCYHDSEFVNEAGSPIGQKMSDIMNCYEGNNPLAFLLFNCISGHSILFRRELATYALPLNKEFFHDWWLAFVAANKGEIKFIDAPLVKYRQHTSGTIDILNLKYALEKAQEINELLKKKTWIEKCAAYDGRCQTYIQHINRLIRPNATWFAKINLYFKLLKNINIIFFVRKQKFKSKKKFLRRQVFKL